MCRAEKCVSRARLDDAEQFVDEPMKERLATVAELRDCHDELDEARSGRGFDMLATECQRWFDQNAAPTAPTLKAAPSPRRTVSSDRGRACPDSLTMS